MKHQNSIARWISELTLGEWIAGVVFFLLVLNSHAFFRAALDLWEWLGW